MRGDKEKLEKILECIHQVRDYTKDGRDTFFCDRKTQDAVVRNLQVIGEAIKDLSENIKKENPDVNWRKAARMRDKVTHDYFEVNYEIVWDTVENSLGSLRERIEDIHQRLVYKVLSDCEQSSKLERKLKDEGM